jgi:hypothetical protein
MLLAEPAYVAGVAEELGLDMSQIEKFSGIISLLFLLSESLFLS